MVTEGAVKVLSELSRENGLEGRRRPDVWCSAASPDASPETRSESVASGMFTLNEHRCYRLLQRDMRRSSKCLQQSLAHGSLLVADLLGIESLGCLDMRGGQNGGGKGSCGLAG